MHAGRVSRLFWLEQEGSILQEFFPSYLAETKKLVTRWQITDVTGILEKSGRDQP